MAYETKIYYGATQSIALELTSVTGMQVTMSFATSSQEGINAEYPIKVTHNGKNTPQLTLSGEIREDSSALIKDRVTGSTKSRNTMAQLWTLVSNSKYKFKIEPFVLATSNTITATTSKNYFIGQIKSLQVQPLASYQSSDGYVGSVISYTMTFALTGE